MSTSTGGGYVYWSGTSAATPVTAAVAALLLTSPHAPTGPSRDDWAADILMGTAVDLGPAGRDDEFGNGRVDAAAAASAAYPSTSETLELTAPEKGQQVLDELRVRGTADAGTEVTIGVTPDGPSSTAVATGGTFDATLDLTSAPSGELTVTVSAPDAAPQTRTVVHDAARPTVTVTGPARPVPAGTVRVSGTVDDDLHVARVTVVLDMEGDPTQTVHAPGDAFTADFDLGGEPAGTVVAMVTAHDEAGRSRTVSHQIDITAATGPGPHRVSGQTRWDTAVAVSSAAFPGGADVVYVATGENFPDALSAVAAAAVEDAPVLITPRTVLPDPVANELARLAPRHVKVVGGTSAVSDAVVDAVAGAAGDVPVTRLAGDDRYATSATVASHPGFVDDTVFLATGQDFPDALAAGSAAARGGHRLLLTDPGDLPQPTATLLRLVKPDRVVVVGGAVAVDDTVIDAVSDLLPEAVVDRVAGSDRFDTAARLSAEFITSDMVWVATGRGFADALSAGAAAARAGAPLLLTEKADLPPVTADRVGALGARTALIAGGPVAVGDTVVDQLASLL